jgi:nucleotide-binding universal stress UspA family protein
VAQVLPFSQKGSMMSYKTVLVDCDASRSVASRLSAAADIAERFGAHLIGVHAREPFDVVSITGDNIPIAPFVNAYNARCDEMEKAARTAYDKATKRRNLRSEWRVVEDLADGVLTTNARYVDLLVLGQADPDDPATSHNDLPEVTALASGRPVLVIPKIGIQAPIGKHVMLCWNASRESARSAADALPFLQAAEQVTVLVVDPDVSINGHGQEPGADVATWLARHGVKVTVQREAAIDTKVGEVILSRAADLGVDLIVMGVYGHSRVREMVLGGASRTLLSSMTVPVLMSH